MTVPLPGTAGGPLENLDVATLLEWVPAIVWVAEPGDQGSWLYVSPRIEEVLGFTPEEWYAHPSPLGTHVHPDDFVMLLALEERLLRERDTHPYTVDFRMRRRDGREIWIHERGNLIDRPGAGPLIQGLFFDVTEHRVVEAELRDANELWQAAFDASPAGMITWDRDGCVLSWSRGAERMYGWTADEAIGNFLPQVPEEERETLLPIIRRGFAGEGVWSEVEVVRRRKDGSPIDVSVSSAPLRDQEGEIVAFISVSADITERKAAVEQLRERERELQQREQLDAIGKLAGGIAHDFNNLLTVIQGQAALALDDARAGLQVDAHLVPILEAAERAGALTRQLLAFGRRQLLQPRVVDVNECVRAIAPLLRRLAGEGVELSFRLGAAPPVEADPTQLDQVLINLVANARDAMPRGGKIVVETRSDTVEAPDREPCDFLALVVSDTGIGMDDSVRTRAFEPFFTTKPVGAGTGLGLSTVYGIVAQSGGTVAIDSEPGRGATILVRLPRAADVDPHVERRVENRGGATRAATILLVEDDSLVRGLVTRLLKLEGYDVLVAPDPIEALPLVESDEVAIDLLVTDVVMPSMSGPDLAARLRDRQPNLPVLYISGYNDTAVAGYGALTEDVDLLQKPFSPDELAARVRAALDRR